MLLPSLPTSRTTTFLAETHEREVVNPWQFWLAMDSGCTCEASRPRWKSSPGKGEPGGPWTSDSLEGSKGGQPIVSKHQHTLQNLSGPEKDAHVKKDTLHYTERKKNSAEMRSTDLMLLPWNRAHLCFMPQPLLLQHHDQRWQGPTPQDQRVPLRTSWLYVVWTHTPAGTGGSCFH